MYSWLFSWAGSAFVQFDPLGVYFRMGKREPFAEQNRRHSKQKNASRVQLKNINNFVQSFLCWVKFYTAVALGIILANFSRIVLRNMRISADIVIICLHCICHLHCSNTEWISHNQMKKFRENYKIRDEDAYIIIYNTIRPPTFIKKNCLLNKLSLTDVKSIIN